MTVLVAIIAALFAAVPFIGEHSLVLGVGIMTVALGLLDVVNERRGLWTTQVAAVVGLVTRIAVFGCVMWLGLASERAGRLFVAGLWAFGLSQMLLDAPFFALMKKWLPSRGFWSRNLASNLVGVVAFVLFSGGSWHTVLAGVGMRIAFSLLALPGLLAILRLLPALALLAALPARADPVNLSWSLRLTEPHHEETLVTLRAPQLHLWGQNLSLFDPGTKMPWNTKTTVGVDLYQTKWFTVSGIGQYQTWEVNVPRKGWQRPEDWRYGVEVRSR